jgi:hypothetical protein
MFNYHAFGLEISSEIELPGMMEALGGEDDIRISRGEVEIAHQDEGPNYLVDQEDIYLWWEDIGQIKVHEGGEITVDAEDEKNIIAFILGPVMSLMLHQKGFLVLHGSAVRVDGGAVAFLGYRGHGKSTTAINLYKYGYPLVADDILAIKFDEKGMPIAYPGYLHVRLSDESYGNVKDSTDVLTPIRTIAGKLFCDASIGFSPEPLPLEGIYILEKGEETGIKSLDSQKDLLDLIIHSTAHRIFREKDQANNLLQCANLINNIPVRRLEITHSFNDMPKTIKAIEEDLSN